MCGIIGVLGQLPEKSIVVQARDTMAHRGPDDQGIYYSPKEGLALGHLRLSIIDLSSTGHQPMISNDHSLVVVFNGEIYNYLEIRKELEGFYDFKTNSDTEVLLAAFMKWGVDCLQKLNGMFAFAIWDETKQKLFVVRDRLGVKPLYYSFYKNSFYFSSEIKGILKLSNIPRKMKLQSFFDFLYYRYPLGSSTFFSDIHSLLPGHYMVLKNGEQPQPVQYWDIPIITEKHDPGEDEVINKTTELLKKSIKYRMISDVHTGAYLSGGLDSSLIVALMAEVSVDRLRTFSVGFEEKGFNEFEFSRQVSDLFKTEHHELTLNSEDYLDATLDIIRIKDAPIAVPFEVSGYILSKELKKYITVILAGEGSDELFGGYGIIFRSAFDFKRMQLLKNEANFSNEERGILENNLREKYERIDYESPLEHFLSQYVYFPESLTNKIISPNILSMRKDPMQRERFQKIFEDTKGMELEEQYMYIFEKIHLLGLLHRLDTSAMARSVEAREPFLDYKLIEYVTGLPLKYKLRWKSEKDKEKAKFLNSTQISESLDTSKYLLRKIASNYLPEEIVNRKKMGPPAPLELWFNGRNKEKVKKVLLFPTARTRDLFNQIELEKWIDEDSSDNDHGLQIWMLYNLEIWMQEYDVSL